MEAFYTQFIQETFDETGQITHWAYTYADNYNYSYDAIDPLGERCSNRLAMLWRNDRGEEKRLTFGALKTLSIQAANLFQSRGLKKGDVIMTALRTHWSYWVVALAAHRLGLVLSPSYYLLTQKDFAFRMQKANVRCVITCRESQAEARVLAAAEEAGVPLRFALGGGDGFEDFLEGVAAQSPVMDRVETRWSEPILLYFTSGTTGQPKGVLHDHAFTLANHWGARYMQDTHDGSLHFATGDTGWEVVSGTKFYGQWLHLGALLVYDYDRFPPEKVLSLLEEVRATGMMAQPTVYRMLTEVGMDRYDLSSITNFAVGGEKLSPDLAQKVTAQTGHVLYEGYAQSEAGLIAAASKALGRKEGSVGKILPKYHVELLKEDGTFAQPGEEGEIILVADGGRRPEGLMMGYLDDEEANRRLWDGDFFHTGDLATRDEDGFLFYRGRFDGIIKTKGYRVSPVEIEDVLSLHPAVYEPQAMPPARLWRTSLWPFTTTPAPASKKSGLWNLLTRWPTTPTASSSGGSSAPKTDHPIPKRGDEPSSSRFSLPVSGGSPACPETVDRLLPPLYNKERKKSLYHNCGRRRPVSLLELKEVTVSFAFPDGRPALLALNQVNLSVAQGELVALVGPSGCGKTTALNVLAGQVVPTSGQVRLAGEPVQGILPSVGYISQADTLLPWRTVLDNVALAMELRGVPKSQRQETARALMKSMGLEGFEQSYPRELSGGMKKRAAIARVLAVDPAILMMDEPFAPLDAFTRQRLQDDILSLWENTGCTILYVTHDLTEAITLADRVVLMSARPGRVVREYPIDLPRPRRVMDVKFSPRFVELERAIWQELEAQLPQEEGRR